MQPDAPEVGRQVRQTDSLDYPFKVPPPSGQAVQVAPGLLWLRQPLPFALDHINVWALEDDGAWTVVDTGMHSEASITAWNSAFAGVLAGRPINRVIGTHMHPDHIGLAGWLRERFNARLWISRTEYLNCRMLVADTGRDAPADAICFYRAAGWDEGAINDYKSRFGSFGRRIYRLPDSFRRLEDGEEILIGARRWRIIVGRGHSPEHVCLHCPDGRLLLSGDQVLPRISSNVSVHPTEPDADPLGEWLHDVWKVLGVVPSVESFFLSGLRVGEYEKFVALHLAFSNRVGGVPGNGGSFERSKLRKIDSVGNGRFAAA